MNILKADNIFIWEALVLSTMVWTQPKKYSSQPFNILGRISVNERKAAWGCPLSILLFTHSYEVCPWSEVIFILFAMMRAMAVWMCFPLRNINLWNNDVGNSYCALCAESPSKRLHVWVSTLHEGCAGGRRGATVVPIFRWGNRGSELCPEPQRWGRHFSKGLFSSKDEVLPTRQHRFWNENCNRQNISLMHLVFVYRLLISLPKGWASQNYIVCNELLKINQGFVFFFFFKGNQWENRIHICKQKYLYFI